MEYLFLKNIWYESFLSHDENNITSRKLLTLESSPFKHFYYYM